MIRLLIPGEPATITSQQKGVNFRSRKLYTKTALKAERRRIKRGVHIWDGKQFIKMKGFFPTPYDCPIHCSVKIVFPLTQEEARKHADKLSDPNFEIPHAVSPDFDNSSKLIIDALSDLKFWVNDSRICDANIHKRRGSNPRIVVAFKPLE